MSVLLCLVMTLASLNVIFASEICPPNFTEFNNQCYLVSNQSIDYHDYTDFCRFHHSIPVSVHSKEENAFLRDLVSAHENASKAWLGSWNSIDWEWRDETPFDYHNFTAFVPDQAGVITMHKDGAWSIIQPSVDKFWPKFMGVEKPDHEVIEYIAICKKAMHSRSKLLEPADVVQYSVDGKSIAIIVLSVCMIGTLALLVTTTKKGVEDQKLIQ